MAWCSVQASENSDRSAQLEQLRAKIQLLRTTLQSTRQKITTAESSLRASETEIAEHSRLLRRLNKQLRQQQNKLADLNERHDRQQATMSRHQQALAQQIRTSYTMGRQGYLKILLSRHDPTTIGRTLTYYDYFNLARARHINTIGTDLLRIESLEQQLTEEKEQLEQLLARQADQLQQREKAYQERKQILVRLQTKAGDQQNSLHRLLNDEAQLVKLIEELHKALSDIPPDVGNLQPFIKLKGKLNLPVEGRIRHAYGETGSSGKLRWQGITITASQGSDVHAIYHGRVAFADWLRNFGWLIIIDHGDGYMSLYGHNEALYKDVGEWVDKDEVIATMGNSGGQNQAGLYFEIRHNGKPRNPNQWLSARR